MIEIGYSILRVARAIARRDSVLSDSQVDTGPDLVSGLGIIEAVAQLPLLHIRKYQTVPTATE